jgi:hypothetical protein
MLRIQGQGTRWRVVATPCKNLCNALTFLKDGDEVTSFFTQYGTVPILSFVLR